MARQGKALPIPEREEEPTYRTTSGWDKYYFYSVPADASICNNTAMKGRRRPATIGPRTFGTLDFTPEQVAAFEKRKGSQGSLMSKYTEMFTQFKRSPSATNVAVSDDHMQTITELTRKAGEDHRGGVKKALVAVGMSSMAPHLFPAGHQTRVDQYAEDIAAPSG